MVGRWISVLQGYDYVPEHRAGAKHGNADGMSRIPPRKCKREDCPDCKIDGKAAQHGTIASIKARADCLDCVREVDISNQRGVAVVCLLGVSTITDYSGRKIAVERC